MAKNLQGHVDRSAFPRALWAFSLTELLVVIAILIILAALLLPALAHAKTKAQAVVCLNHVKQWGLALLLYTEENTDYFPYEGWHVEPINTGKNLQAWYNVLPLFMRNLPLMDLYAKGQAPRPDSRSVFSCPNTVTKPAAVLTPKNAFFMYGFNCRLDPNNKKSNWLMFSRSQVIQPSKTVILADSSENKFPTTSGVYAPARHHNRANMTFVDGHSEAVRKEDYSRTKDEDEDSETEWNKPREVYWYPFRNAPE
jgi:prepilin-type processing-associated H-X9-DG protein